MKSELHQGKGNWRESNNKMPKSLHSILSVFCCYVTGSGGRRKGLTGVKNRVSPFQSFLYDF